MTKAINQSTKVNNEIRGFLNESKKYLDFYEENLSEGNFTGAKNFCLDYVEKRFDMKKQYNFDIGNFSNYLYDEKRTYVLPGNKSGIDVESDLIKRYNSGYFAVSDLFARIGFIEKKLKGEIKNV